MQGTLILAVLDVKSSFIEEVEKPLENADDVPDTLQWWLAPGNAWRIKTFALDHDIHVYSVGAGTDGLIELAQSNNRKHYGDVITCEHVLRFLDCMNANDVQQVFKRVGLPPRLEVAEGRFAFWKPDEAKYRTQSQPKREIT
jgi:hypothetical protein